MYGSTRKTSSAAPATLPERIAATSASSSIRSPRAAFTIRTPSFIRASAAASTIPRVSSFRGRWSVITSAFAKTSSSDAAVRSRAPESGRPPRTGRRRRRPFRGRGRGSRPAGRYGRARARPASCLRARSREALAIPASELSAACACGTFRASARSRAIACSAAESTVDSAAFATTIPRRVAASTSTLSTPTPARR